MSHRVEVSMLLEHIARLGLGDCVLRVELLNQRVGLVVLHLALCNEAAVAESLQEELYIESINNHMRSYIGLTMEVSVTFIEHINVDMFLSKHWDTTSVYILEDAGEDIDILRELDAKRKEQNIEITNLCESVG